MGPINQNSNLPDLRVNFPTVLIASILAVALGVWGFVLLLNIFGDSTETQAERIERLLTSQTMEAEVRHAGFFEATPGPGGLQGELNVFEYYNFYDSQTDENILIDNANAEDFVVVESPTSGLRVVGENDPGREANAFLVRTLPASPGGEYKFLINLRDGRVYSATLNLPEPQVGDISVTQTGQTRENDDGTISVAFSTGETDLREFAVMFHIHPDGTIDELHSMGENLLWLTPARLQEGEHVFWLKDVVEWFRITIDNPEDF